MSKLTELMTSSNSRFNSQSSNLVPQHEKLFDEICNKLNELSHRTEAENLAMDETLVPQQKYEKMQLQMRKFHSELQESQEEIKEKIKSLGNVTYGAEGIDAQVRQLAEQLHLERENGNKLSSDLAKSLELSLTLQLEIQGVKTRAMQIQAEDKKYSQALFEKNKNLLRELDLNQALKDEMSLELAKAKNAFQKETQLWEEQREHFEKQISALKTEKSQLQNDLSAVRQDLENKEQEIQLLNSEIEKISSAFSEVETSADQQDEVLQNLMQVAESKIVEMKLAMDKKSLEAQDYYSHLQQALAQAQMAKQENLTLKDYIGKLNHYHQQVQAVQQHALQTQSHHQDQSSQG